MSGTQWLRIRRLAECHGDVAVDDGRHGGFLYRPQELLVASEDVGLVEEELRRYEPRQQDAPEQLAVARFLLGRPVDVPELVERLRRPVEGRAPRVSVNHVLSGEPHYHGGPYDFPCPTEDPFERASSGGGGVTVAVLDTGFVREEEAWFDDHVAGDADPLDSFPPQGALDLEAGHGTFVGALVLQQAPDAEVWESAVLDSDGYGDELRIAGAMLELERRGAGVLNLSLGGYSQGDRPPLALARAVRALQPQTAVVAAAGNNGSHRPMWPGAFKRVLAVGALDDDGAPAPFSNHGFWVDACAHGVRVVSAFPRFVETVEVVPGRGAQKFDGWARWSGTSFATPKAAGAIAALAAAEKRSPHEAAWELLGRAGAETAGVGVDLGL